jgi:hypothetical protein
MALKVSSSSGSGGSGVTAAGGNLFLNTGTIYDNHAVTQVVTAGVTTSVTVAQGTKHVNLTMPTSGTVTLAPSLATTNQQFELHLNYGTALPSLVNMLSANNWVYPTSGGATYYSVAASTVNTTDDITCFSADGTHARVRAIVQGFTF